MVKCFAPTAAWSDVSAADQILLSLYERAEKEISYEESNRRHWSIERLWRSCFTGAGQSLEPADADVGRVAEAIVKVVETPFGKRSFRVHVDPAQDGCEIVNGVADRIRAELLRNIGLQDLLTPRDLAAESQSAA